MTSYIVHIYREMRLSFADEDCPSDHRSRHFDNALEEAHTAIAEAKAVPITPVPCAHSQPPRFDYAYEPEENPNRAYVMVEGLYDVAVIRLAEGIAIDVFPKDWIDPIDSLTVWDEQVAVTHDDDR